MITKQITELNDALSTLHDGEGVLMKEFRSTKEYAIIDYAKKGMHPNDHRYLFDWKKMKMKLSREAIQHYKTVEQGKQPQTVGWYQEDIHSKNKEKKFIGFSNADVSSYYFTSNAMITYNTWIESETEVIRYKSDNRKERWCKVRVLHIIPVGSVALASQINVVYKRVELPSGIL